MIYPHVLPFVLQVELQRGTVFRPIKMYYYRKPSYLLARAFRREGFPDLCELWRTHPVTDGEYSDVWDGSVWREQHAEFLSQPHAIALMLMDDNFNPNGSHARKRYSMGSI